MPVEVEAICLLQLAKPGPAHRAKIDAIASTCQHVNRIVDVSGRPFAKQAWVVGRKLAIPWPTPRQIAAFPQNVPMSETWVHGCMPLIPTEWPQTTATVSGYFAPLFVQSG